MSIILLFFGVVFAWPCSCGDALLFVQSQMQNETVLVNRTQASCVALGTKCVDNLVGISQFLPALATFVQTNASTACAKDLICSSTPGNMLSALQNSALISTVKDLISFCTNPSSSGCTTTFTQFVTLWNLYNGSIQSTKVKQNCCIGSFHKATSNVAIN